MASTPKKLPHFYTAIDAIFKNWSGLQLAVANNAGGPQSVEIAQWMVQVTENWFYENKDLEPYEVTEFLEEIISQEFNVMIDDGSGGEIGRLICQYFVLCSKEDESVIKEKLKSLPRCDLSLSKVENDDGEMDDTTENISSNVVQQVEGMDIENNINEESEQSRTDEDGFTVVSRKKKK